jgi:Domain of unknown function (DUF4115)
MFRRRLPSPGSLELDSLGIRRPRDPETWVLSIALVAGLLFIALVYSGAVLRRAKPSAHVAAIPVVTTAPPSVQHAPLTPPKRTRPTIVITATRGDCWVSTRIGSSSGKVIFEGVLRHGRSVITHDARVWARFGSSANVDVTVNGRRRSIPIGTVDVVL